MQVAADRALEAAFPHARVDHAVYLFAGSRSHFGAVRDATGRSRNRDSGADGKKPARQRRWPI